jgi:hypothetical protein
MISTGPHATGHSWLALDWPKIAWITLKVTLSLKPIDLLTASDLAASPIWKYTNRDGASELTTPD